MKKITGNLIIEKGDTRDFSELEEVTGYCHISSNVTFEAPKLTTIGGDCYIYSNVTFKAPKLTTIGGYCYISSNVTLPKLTNIGGYCSIYSDVTFEAPKLTTIGGYCSIYSDVTFEAPKLTTIGGYCYISSNVTLPKLTTIGGYCYIHSDVTFEALFLKGKKWMSVDGRLFVVESEKKVKEITIFKGYNVIGVKDNEPKKEQCYVAKKGDFFAHGKTIKQAVEDLEFKIISETLKNEPIKPDTIIDIKYYQLVTGSCTTGIESFIKGNKLKSSYKAKDLLPILEKANAYGLDKFKSLITF